MSCHSEGSLLDVNHSISEIIATLLHALVVAWMRTDEHMVTNGMADAFIHIKLDQDEMQFWPVYLLSALHQCKHQLYS
jgi:hypothetical protein